MSIERWMCIACTTVMVACGPSAPSGSGIDGHAGGSNDGNPGSGGDGDGGADSGYLVCAHNDTVLYSINVATKALVTVGNFNAPNVMVGSAMEPDVMTDLAVAPSGTIYMVSETALYTASAMDGHVTSVGSLSTCGTKIVALTTTSDGRLWVGDYKGAICQIDISGATPVVDAPVTMTGGLALSGDMVGIGNGTVFGSAYLLTEASGHGSQLSNILVTVDVDTGATTQIGASGYPNLFGVAYQQGQVFGFTHDTTGRVVTIDTTTGVGTLFSTFTDPTTNKGISFAGAGVNSLILVE